MLVISREAGDSVMIGDHCLVTILKLLHNQSAIAVLISQSSESPNGAMDVRTVTIELNHSWKIRDGVEITLVDLRGDKARVGVTGPADSVHRLEVYEAIRGTRRHEGDDPDDGLSVSGVPRPFSPAPPSLDASLDEPHLPDEEP